MLPKLSTPLQDNEEQDSLTDNNNFHNLPNIGVYFPWVDIIGYSQNTLHIVQEGVVKDKRRFLYLQEDSTLKEDVLDSDIATLCQKAFGKYLHLSYQYTIHWPLSSDVCILFVHQMSHISSYMAYAITSIHRRHEVRTVDVLS